MLLYPGLYGIIVVHIRREQMQKETFLQFQAFSLDELLCVLKHPEESEELVHYSTARTKPYYSSSVLGSTMDWVLLSTTLE